MEGEGDKTGFKISPVWTNKDRTLDIDNFYNLKNLPVKMVLLESGKEIYFDIKLFEFAVHNETILWEKDIETEVSLIDPRLKDFKEGVVYEGNQENISFVTDKNYYLICTPSEDNSMEDPLLNVNGSEYDDSETFYPEPVLLEKGLQNISVRNLSDTGSGFELQIIEEDQYIGGNLLDEDEIKEIELPQISK